MRRVEDVRAEAFPTSVIMNSTFSTLCGKVDK